MEERIKAMEKTDDVAPAKPPHKKNRFRHLLGEMWPAYVIEVVVIILGISITLVLEEWRDKGKEAQLEKVYKENLAADIDADRRSLQFAASGTDTILARGEEIRQFVKDPDGHALTAQRLNEDVRYLIGRPKFIPHEATFSDLKSSGNMHLIDDVTIKWTMFSYYSQTVIIKEIQDAEQQATIELSGKYFLQWFAVDGSDDSPIFRNPGGVRSLAANPEFRNQVILRVSTREELKALYKEADSLARQLLAGLRTHRD